MFKSTGKKKSPIAQGKKACQWLFQHMGGKCPTFANIYIIVWPFPHMCAFSHTYVSKSKHAWKKAPRCQYINVFGVFHTWGVKVKHLPKCTCVVINTHVWLVLNIFTKSQTCVEKTIMFSPNIPTLFFEGNKDFVIRSCSQFKKESSSVIILLGMTSSSLKLKDGWKSTIFDWTVFGLFDSTAPKSMWLHRQESKSNFFPVNLFPCCFFVFSFQPMKRFWNWSTSKNL